MDDYFILLLPLHFTRIFLTNKGKVAPLQERRMRDERVGYGPREVMVGMDARAIGMAGTTAMGSQMVGLANVGKSTVFNTLTKLSIPAIDLEVEHSLSVVVAFILPLSTDLQMERSCILYRAADLIEKRNDEIAMLESWDSGKPYEKSGLVEIAMVVHLMRYYACWADKIHGLVVPADGPHHARVLYEPIGVAGQIVPWNYPLIMFAWKVGPALACGNTVVLKTAHQTPLSALYVAKLFYEDVELMERKLEDLEKSMKRSNDNQI